MSTDLHLPHHIHLYQKIVEIFSDVSFSDLITEKLKQAIVDCDNLVLSTSIVKKFCLRYFQPSEFESKAIFKQVELVFKTLCVYIVSREQRARSTFFHSTDEFLQEYPDFKLASPQEILNLLEFRNMVKATLVVVEARLNKQLILDIAARLEGNFVKCITGSGQSLAVRQRVVIYEKEGSVQPEKRPFRANQASPATGPNTTNKKKRKTPSSTPEHQKIDKKQKSATSSKTQPELLAPPIPAPTSSSAPRCTPDFNAGTGRAEDSLVGDDDFLELLAELPFEEAPCSPAFGCAQKIDRGVPMIRTPCLAPQSTSHLLEEALRAALERGFYKEDRTMSNAVVGKNEDDLFERALHEEEEHLLLDLGFSFDVSDFTVTGM